MLEFLASGELLDAVRGLHWPARRVARGAYQGGHRSRRTGSSPEFMQYREYRPGDNPSKIDWKLFGRTERVAVRETHDDSNLRTSILVDASASMAYPPPDLEKWKLAAAIAVALSVVTQQDRDPVGLAVVSGTEVQVVPPRARMSTSANLLRVLSGVMPSGSAPLAPTLASLRSSNRIAIVSDFLGDAEALLDLAGEMIASGREIYAVHIVAREELDPEPHGSLVVDPEDDELRRPLDQSGIAEYREAFTRWREELAASWRAAGAVYNLAITGEPIDQTVRRITSPTATAAVDRISS